MHKEEATKLLLRPLDQGSMTGEESFIVNKSAFTHANLKSRTTKLVTRIDNNNYSVTVQTAPSDEHPTRVLFQDELKTHLKSFQQAKEQVQEVVHHIQRLDKK